MRKDERNVGKVFKSGGSQAVRLPRQFWFESDSVRIERVEGGLLLRPYYTNVREWLARIDRNLDESFPKERPEQPPMPPDRDLFP